MNYTDSDIQAIVNTQVELKTKELQERINKAIEFIADYKDQWIGNDDIVDDMNELLSILKEERQ